ncbi:hypothetical protein H2199_002537 [Coniosporium tulheliwenetii]|uniref:Uncharacterized protein n=1 Tax=Coniosporium tulheliwenetii TaxID=3383036 RepID=A0ACC2ZFW9_9PEZI|nr:hypothetical protein H2199_002537 [Cladosporium sp. JES 115]
MTELAKHQRHHPDKRDPPPFRPKDARPKSVLSGFATSLEDNQQCNIYIYDDASPELGARSEPTQNALDVSQDTHLPGALTHKTSNIVGWDEAAIKEITDLYIGHHRCLDPQATSEQILGGPSTAPGGHEVIWIKTSVVYRKTRPTLGVHDPSAIPNGGTVITNFTGPHRLAEEMSSFCTERIIDEHPYGRNSLACVWILAFSILRVVAEQLDFAFNVFDPIQSHHGTSILFKLPRLPQLDDLPVIMEKLNNLALIERYLSGLEEFTVFFQSVQQTIGPAQDTNLLAPERYFSIPQTRKRAQSQAVQTKNNIAQQQKLCKIYINQFESLIQMTISYSTTQITDRLDKGRIATERFTKVGIAIAGIAAIVTPLSLLTSFFGMNVVEFSPDASATLFDFWQIGVPVLLATAVGFSFLSLWLLTDSEKAGGNGG